MNNDMNKVLLYFALKYNGDFHKIFDALNTKEKFDSNQFIKLKRNLRYKYVTMINRNYPDYLKRENSPYYIKHCKVNKYILKKIIGHEIRDVTETIYTHRGIDD